MVAGVRHGFHRCAGCAIGDRLWGSAADRTVLPGSVGQGEGIEGKAGGDGVVGGDVVEGVAGDWANRNVIHQDVGHMVV